MNKAAEQVPAVRDAAADEHEARVFALKEVGANPEQRADARRAVRGGLAEINDLREQIRAARASESALVTELRDRDTQLQAAQATIALALEMDDTNQPRNVINHVLARYVSSHADTSKTNNGK